MSSQRATGKTSPSASTAKRLLWIVAMLALAPLTKSLAADLVTETVDAARLSALPQSRVAWATAANDLGELAGDLPLSHLSLVLKRSAEQQLAFEQLLAQQQDPDSPNFHRWLTPVELGEQFGASQHDIDALTQWLQAQGLQVDAIANSRMRITFSGTAAKVGAAFASSMHAYFVNGGQRIAIAAVPQIPVALSAVVDSVFGLVRIDDHAFHGAGDARLVVESSTTVRPDGSVSCSQSGCTHFIWPADFATIYDLNPAYAQGVTGSGQTIAIIGRARVYLPDIENFQSKSGLPVKDPVIIVPPGGIDPGPAVSTGGSVPSHQAEATLDVTRAGSVAPGATIKLVASADSSTVSGIAITSQYVVDASPVQAQIMNLSFGDCEADAGQVATAFWDNLFSQAAAEGISVFVSSGDAGASCDAYFSVPPATQVASPNYICASSYATCVGGTQFADTVNPAAYWSATNGPGFGSALGYIPEGAWNEPLNTGGTVQAAASGGGVSAFVPTPSWQKGPGVPGAQGRYTPDVAFSSSGHDGYFVCTAASGASCVSDNTGSFHFAVYSGTSAAAPDMAGIAALLNQRAGGAQGNLNPRLYALAATAGSGVFHDVTVATSGVAACSSATPSMCNNSTPGPTSLSGGLAGYVVGPGYDLATGLGSIDVTNLLAQWSGPTNAVNYTGLFWRSPAGSESGWGINFAHQGDVIFATWFTYDLTGKWWWLSMTANKTANATYTGTFFQTNGPAFNAVPFNPAAVTSTAVGTGTVTFSDVNNATFAYSVNGVTQTKPITRQVFGTVPTCVWGAQPNLALATNYQDLWWASGGTESGWGVNLTQEGNTIFATWFTYNGDGTPLWLSATANNTAPGVYQGTLFLNQGPPFNAVPFNPANVVASPVGTATFTFANGNSATFTYSVTTNGGSVTQTKSITRQVFRAPGTVCQ